MSDYKSFYYLMSGMSDAIKPAFITPPTALRFDELYSPREGGCILIGKSEKHFWRTRDRIQFNFYANREQKVVFVTCCNLEDRTVYRTIFFDAEVLYYEVECKAQEGHRTKLTRKREKRLFSDEMLHRQVVEYIRARLFITNDLLLWPDFDGPASSPTFQDCVARSVDEADSTRFVQYGVELPFVEGPPVDVPPLEPIGYTEKMVTFNKLSNDLFEKLEINMPTNLSLEGIQFTKILPTDYVAPVPKVEVVEEVTPPVAEKSTVVTRKSSRATMNNPRRPSGAIPSMASMSLPALVPPTTAAPAVTGTGTGADAADLTPLTVESPAPAALVPKGTNPNKQVVSITKVKYPPLTKSPSIVKVPPLVKSQSIVKTRTPTAMSLKMKPVVKGPVPAAIAGTATMPSTPAAPYASSTTLTGVTEGAVDPVSVAATDTDTAAAFPINTNTLPVVEVKKKSFPFAVAGARATMLLGKKTNKVVPA